MAKTRAHSGRTIPESAIDTKGGRCDLPKGRNDKALYPTVLWSWAFAMEWAAI